MAKFLIRVYFQNQTKSFNEKVKDVMESENFKSEAVINNRLVQLPVGEFYIEGQYTMTQIISSTKKALVGFSEKYSLLVSECIYLDEFNLLPNFQYKR